MLYLRISAAAVAAALAVPVHAQSEGELAQKFGARPSVLDVALSPSGGKFAVVSPLGADGEAVHTVDLNNPAQRKIAISNTDPLRDISWCEWASETRLICNIVGASRSDNMIIGYNRFVAFNEDGANAQIISTGTNRRTLGAAQDGGSIVGWSVEGEDDAVVLMTREYIPEFSTGTKMASDEDGLGVDLLDTGDLKRRKVENARKEAVRYVADGKGKVRLVQERDVSATGYLTDRTRYLYRPLAGGAWQALKPAPDLPEEFEALAVDSAANVAYGFGKNNGYESLYSVALDGTGKGQMLLTKDGIDIDRLIRIGAAGRVIGASYASEKRQVDYFDPQLKSLAGALHQALPGRPLIDIVDASDDEKKLLLIASSDTDPGMIYLYHKDSRQLEEIIPLRAELAGMPMGEMKPVTFPAGDGTKIPGYLTLPPGSQGKNLPAIVLPHGGPSARDEWGFDWLVQHFVHLGYAVLQPNFRGSAGYGSEWFQKNGFQSWNTAISDVNDAGRWLVKEGIADPQKLSIVGWSYGGYAALQSAVVDPSLYKAVVAIAPVTDLEALRDDHRKFTNYALADKFIGQGEHVAAGSPARHAAKISAPVLLLHGDMDQNADVGHSQRMARALQGAGKSVAYVEFKGLDHFIDHGPKRTEMLQRITGFLAQSPGLAAK